MLIENINLAVKNVGYHISSKTILTDICFTLNGAQSVCLLGPNGAGKSTLLKLIASLVVVKKGTISLSKLDSEKHRSQYLSQIGYMPENAIIFPELNVSEQLYLFATNKQVKHPKKNIQQVVEMCQLQTVLKQRTNRLSLGFKQRLNLAQALLNQPSLILMDEPLNGLDPHLIVEFRNIINTLKKHAQVIISTHYLAEAQAVSDRVLLLKDGCLLDDIDMTTKSNSGELENIYMQHTSQDVLS